MQGWRKLSCFVAPISDDRRPGKKEMNRNVNIFEPPKLLLDKCDFCGRFIFAGEPSVPREGKLFCRESCDRADREEPSAEA